jgi:hypothetical protein
MQNVETKMTEEVKKNIVVVQFRYKNYQEIIDIPDNEQAKTNTGIQPKMVVKARNWRSEFNLDDPIQKQVLDRIKSSKQYGKSFWILDDVDKRKDKAPSRAGTLQKLLAMSDAQLNTMLTSQEMEASGLVPGRATKMELIMAIIDNKKLV